MKYRNFKNIAVFMFTSSIIITLMKSQGGENIEKPEWEDPSLPAVLWQETQEMRLKGPLTEQDPNLLRLLRESYLQPPSSEKLNLMLDKSGMMAESYNSYRTGFGSWQRLHGILKKLYSDQPPGIFLEAGALDGEFISNTLYLERDLGWTGLLIEADPFLYSGMPEKHRRSWISNSCLSTTSFAELRTFESYSPKTETSLATDLLIRSTGNLEGVHAPAAGQMGVKKTYTVQCFPLISYLLASNLTTLQYVSLDVEGAEADVLLSIPWDKIDVTVWMVEHRSESTGFRDLYMEPGGVKPPKLKIKEQQHPDHQIPNNEIQQQQPPPPKVVYITEHDPAGGKDDYFVLFMKEKGYKLYDYWDGDYTFIKADSELCDRHCNVVGLDLSE